MTRVLIAGYPYIKESYFKTFSSYQDKDKLIFLLPKIWKAKGGKLKFYPPSGENVFKANAYFFHSNYPIIGGLLKGWMPSFPLVLLKVKNKIDLVYSPSEPILLTTLYQGLWTKTFGKKHIIFTWENVPYNKKFRGLNLFIKMLILKLNFVFCDGIICGNKKAEEIISNLKIKNLTCLRRQEFKIKTIPLSGVDVDFFKRGSGIKKINNVDLSDKVVFNFSGAVGHRKGLHILLESFRRVLSEIPNIHLLIIGSGEDEGDVKLKVKNLNLEKNITLIPWLGKNDLKNTLNMSDIFIYPSLSYGGWEEQFGYSMAEASLMELPIISTRTGSIDEVVLDNQTGLLVEPDNVEQLYQTMLKLAKNPELRKELGLYGRKFISENYNYKVVADKFYKFFNEICIHS